ncbi:MAG: PaaI family thioesterase [Hungatella sp.]|uniref:PaaI family thioesterase n=1 Tax=Hungatella sp. TaxID=2613924 RepID=UPI0039922202
MRPEIMDGILRHIHPIGGIENARLLEVSPGHAKLSMEITQEALNLYGNVHGGFLFSLCDMAAGMSTYACETTNVTECSSINFLRGGEYRNHLYRIQRHTQRPENRCQSGNRHQRRRQTGGIRKLYDVFNRTGLGEFPNYIQHEKYSQP